ncbi:MAG: diguanylate cyclase [Candidatus Omnitrophica bacterium]|nr:diguanylate cyclase [Candidatus Omnitrophota bacterium]
MEKRVGVLLIEDEKVTRETLKIILEEEEDYDVVGVANGHQAIEKAKERFFNIAIIDLKLPDINGLEVLRKLKQISPDICAFIITAYPSIETTVKAIQKEAYDYIIKPYEVSQIKFVIRRGLEKQELSIENKRLLASIRVKKEKLEHLVQIGKTMSAILNLDELVNFIVSKVAKLLTAEKSSLMLLDEKTGKLTIKAAKGLNKDAIKKTEIKLGSAVAGMVAQQGEPLLVKNIEKDKRFKRKNSSKYKSKSFLSLPLKIKGKVTGVINIADKIPTPTGVFTEDDLKVLSVIIHQAAVAIENAKLYKDVTNLAITDSVTGLFNHRYFQERLTQEVNRIQRYGGTLSLAILDVDLFKKYNDTYGHLYGDRALRDIADILRNSIRKVDVAARYGGDEFVVILPETDMQGAEIVAKKIRQRVEEFPFAKKEDKPPVRLTISIGIAAYRKDLEKKQFIDIADKALYQAKKQGKSRIYLVKPD